MDDQRNPDDTLPDDACLDTLVDVAVLELEIGSTEAEVRVPVLAPRVRQKKGPAEDT